MSQEPSGDGRLVTIFGGSGFVGRHVVRALAREGWRVRVACRRPDLAIYLQPLGDAGQIVAVQANVRHPESVAAALAGADAAINLVGVLTESGPQSFDAIQVEGARTVAQAVAAAGIASFVHMSALGADPHSASRATRSKAEGEAVALAAVPGAVVLRPSIIFGPEDDFFNRFARMASLFPVVPIVGAQTRFQPVYVGDVARVIAMGVDGAAAPGRIYELGGPEIKTFEELVRYILAVIGRERFLLKMPFPMGWVVALSLEIAEKISFGLFPQMLAMSRDQVRRLKVDNVVSAKAIAEGRTLDGLGIAPQSIESIVPSYLAHFRKAGLYETPRAG